MLRFKSLFLISVTFFSACAIVPKTQGAETDRVPTFAFEPRLKKFSPYFDRMAAIVQVQWERIIVQSGVFPPLGSSVSVSFCIDRAGEISNIIESGNTAGKRAYEACKKALTARGPYGKWTDDMIAELGESQTFTFTFFYGS